MPNKILYLFLKHKIININDLPIYQYGIFVICFNTILIITILLIGFLLNNILFAINFLIYFTPIRILLGGYHCSTPHNCIISFSLIFVLINIINNTIYKPYLCFISIFTLLLCIIHNNKQKKTNQWSIFIIFMLTICSSFFLQNSIYIFNSFGLNSILYFANILKHSTIKYTNHKL